MTDATLIADLVRAGVDADLIGRVALLMSTSADVRRQSADASADARRERDRARQAARRKALKLQREKEAAQANDGAAPVTKPSADASADSVDDGSNLPSFSSSLEVVIVEGSEEKKGRLENTRARGTRMEPGAALTDEFRQAAIKLGAPPQFIDEMWVEHVDYWVAVPGQRGVKTDWLATWRNDVRRKLKMGAYTSQKAPNVAEDRSLVAAARRASERVAGALGLGDRASEPIFRIVSQS